MQFLKAWNDKTNRTEESENRYIPPPHYFMQVFNHPQPHPSKKNKKTT